MRFFNWSDTFISGFSNIDQQHQELFRSVNEFAKKSQWADAPSPIVAKLFEDLESFAEIHFLAEETLMEELSFPMTSYHKNLHNRLRRSLRKAHNLLKSNALEDPIAHALDLCRFWLRNHIAQEDLIFINFCHNRGYSLDENFLGRRCVVFTQENEFLCAGTITTIIKNEIAIESGADKNIPTSLNQLVKVSSISDKNEHQTFMARVFFSTDRLIKLFGATLIQTVNQRRTFRVATDYGALMFVDSAKHGITVMDMSANGLLVRTDQQLGRDGVVIVKFSQHGLAFEEPCRVAHVTDDHNTFVCGLSFLALEPKVADTLSMFTLGKQAHDRRMSSQGYS